MKTTRRPKFKNKIWISACIIVGVLLVAVIINYGGLLIAMPFMKVGASIHQVGVAAFGIFESKNSIEVENQKLKDQLAQVQVNIDRDKLLTQENSELKDLLGRHDKNTSILATVLSKPPLSLYDSVVVDVGSSDHITAGDLVLASGFVPVGGISTVSSHTSTVSLFSSFGQKVEVRIGKNIQTLAEAQGGGEFLIKLPKGTVLAEGDPISAPGIGAGIFGHVENIQTNENDPFIYVRFNLPVNLSELHFLQIDRTAAL
jgi:cell shape-determining protein MreC